MSDSTPNLAQISAARRVHDNDELRREICSLIPKDVLPKCARVSEKWLATTSEVIWREVSMDEFMRLTPLGPTPSNLTLRSTTYYLPSVRCIHGVDGTLKSNMRCAHFLTLLHPHILEMKGEKWSISFATRTITTSRTIDLCHAIPSIQTDHALSGFSVVENLTVNPYDGGLSDGSSENSWSSDDSESDGDTEVGARMTSVDEIFTYNTTHQDDQTVSRQHVTPIKSLRWQRDHWYDVVHPWCARIPEFLYLEKIDYTDLRGNLDLTDFSHLVSNKSIRELDLSGGSVSLRQLPDLIQLSSPRISGDLNVRLSIETNLADAKHFKKRAKALQQSWIPNVAAADAGPHSTAPYRIWFICQYDVTDSDFGHFHDRDAVRRAVARYLDDGCNLISNLCNRAVVTFERGTALEWDD